MSEEPLQKSLERYDVLDRIAVGGMAEVFLAKAYGAHGFEKTIAIKKILPELARDPEFEARFIAEAKVAVRLSHANVVQVLDFGRIGESLFIAMEYVDGLDLAAMLRKFKDEKRYIPLPAAFHIAIEIIRALDFAHSHNVVHRDVSPSNILVSRAGEVKIADFGIAVAARPHRGATAGPKRVMGKWRYMSPEQTRGDTLDTRSDLFSAAAVIYELFTNEKLFPGDESDEIIKNIHEMPIPRMSALRPGMPSRLDDVLAGALARKPIDRPLRPASVLRSMIELSYESSIMATALDVAEALATVIPAKRVSGRGALDDVIRKQLNEQSVARRTAVTDGKPPSTETVEREQLRGEVSTGLFRKQDVDGVSRLEEIDANTKVAAPRARRISEHADAMPGDSGLHQLLNASVDKDRHTEVGGPPTGTIPKDLADDAPAPRATGTQSTLTGAGPTGTRRGTWLALALALAVAIGGGVFALGRDRDPEKIVVPAMADAAIGEAQGTLTIEPNVDGATGYIELAGDDTTRKPLDFAKARSFEAKLPANTKIHIHLEHASFRPYDDSEISLAPGERLRVRPMLDPAPARLAVATEPGGVQVALAGRVLGDSPRTFDELEPGKALELVLAKPGYLPITLRIDLFAGKTTEIRETLREAQKFGYVQIVVTGSWAEVYLGSKKLGQNRTATGLATFQVPVGKQQLRLVNRQANKQKLITVQVTERKTTTLTVGLD